MPTLQAPTKPQTVIPEAIKRPPLWARVLRSAGFVALVVLGLEGALSLAGIGEQEYLKPDPAFGFTGMPNKTVTWRQEGFGRIHFNSLGMPDIERPLAKPAGTTRIAVLGDSFVEAMQVDREKNFCAVLERNLNQAGLDKKFEVLNFGTSAYNIGQMYLRLKQQASLFQPDVVVVACRHDGVFALVPDANGGLMSARPAFYLNNHKLEFTNMVYERWARSADGKRVWLTSWLREHSHIYGAIGTMIHDLKTQLPNAFKFNSIPKESQPAPTLSRAALNANSEKATRFYWPLQQALLSEMKKECDRIGAKLIVVRLPRSPLSNNEIETQLLIDAMKREGVPLVLTDQDYEAASASREKLYYGNHFAPAGHRLMAKNLQPYILSTMGIPSKVNP